MYLDPRGGSNRRKFNADFFKRWSNKMAYVLGFLYADGNITNAVKSSRTQYIKFSNNDKEILRKIKLALESEHAIRSRPPHLSLHKNGKFYQSSESFSLRIGSKKMFNDLLKFGLTPSKSKTMRLPHIPSKYLPHFVRGYFDGDGTIYIGPKEKIIKANVSFSSGGEKFLKSLSNSLTKNLGVKKRKTYKGKRDFQIRYYTKESIDMFKFMYNNSNGLFLQRKFDIFKQFFDIRNKWLDKKVVKILNQNTKIWPGTQTARERSAKASHAGANPALVS